MMTVLVPKPRITLVTAPSKPAMMEPTPIMVPVPMITPRMVRNDRILCSRTVSSANPMAELSSTRVIWSRSSFHSQRFNRIKFRSLLRRINSEEQPHGGGEADAHQNGRHGHGHGNRREPSHRGGNHPGDHHADEASHAGEHGGFD